MLKRQRQSSPPPPPTSSNINLLIDLSVEEQHAKRRRTQLDGSLRDGSRAVDDDDSYEESLDDHAVNAASHESTEIPVEYKSANIILRELHILNQHRLMFTPAPDSSMTLHPTHDGQLPYTLPHVGHSTLSSKLPTTPMQTGNVSNPDSPRHKTVEQDKFWAGPMEEANAVSEIYGNINKYVYLFSPHLTPLNILDFQISWITFPFT